MLDNHLFPFRNQLTPQTVGFENGDGEEPIEIEEFDEEAAQIKQTPFYDNLAEDLDDAVLNKISTYLCSAIEEDALTRKTLIDAANNVLKHAGITQIEDLLGEGGDNKVLPNTLRTFDSTFLACLVRTYAEIVSQLYPAMGPAGVYINGKKDQYGDIEDVAATARDYINYYLTVKDVGYYPDAMRAVLYTIFYGSGFKKVYYDPYNVAISRFIPPHKFIINAECSSILESERITHELDLSKKTILTLMDKGVYKKLDLPYLKGLDSSDMAERIVPDLSNTTQVKENKSYGGEFPWYECHVYLNLKDFTDNENPDKYSLDIPLPYVVTIDQTTRKIASIRRNWLEHDENFKRIEMFVVSNYMQGFNIYGIGLLHLIGSEAITLTKLQRVLVDAGIYQNLPAGICAKGIKNPDKDFLLAPGQFKQVDVVGSVKEAFIPLPFNGPSPALLELYKLKIEQTKELGSIGNMGITETKDNVSPITALAVMDHAAKLQSVVLQSLHYSLSRELQMVWEVLKNTVQYEKFTFGQKSRVIRKEDFIEQIAIIPVSDPELNSRMQKMMKVQAIQTISQNFQGMFKQEAIARKMLEALGANTQYIDDIMYSEEELQQMQEAQGSQPQQITADELTRMDIEQRAQETEARIKIEGDKTAAQVFKTEVELHIAATKMQMEQEIADRKAYEIEMKTQMDKELQEMREILAAQQREWEKELALLKIEADREKNEIDLEQTELKIEADKDIAEYKASVDLIKQI